VDHAQEALGELVAPGRDGPHLLEPPDLPLHGVAPAVGLGVEGGRLGRAAESVPAMRDDGLDAALLQPASDARRAVGSVA
jgi:hypothetical protein